MANQCGIEDKEGWTLPVPTPAQGTNYTQRRSLTETGSRLHYISVDHGNDDTGEIYFWNGTNIMDASGSTLGSDGQPYGTDPMNPS
jgi:hypothetical protein